MGNFEAEHLIFAPVEAARIIGRGVLWITERLVPATPTVEGKPASIQYFNTGPEPEDRRAA